MADDAASDKKKNEEGNKSSTLSVVFAYHSGALSTSVGLLPGNWLAAHIAVLTPDLQMHLS